MEVLRVARGTFDNMIKRRRKECEMWGMKTVRRAHTHKISGVNWIRQIWNGWQRHPHGLAVNRIAVAEPGLRNVCAVHGRHSRERDNSSVSSHVLAGTIPVSSTRPASTHLCDAFLDTTRLKTNRCGDRHLKNSLDGIWFSEFVKHWYSAARRQESCTKKMPRISFDSQFAVSVSEYVFMSSLLVSLL